MSYNNYETSMTDLMISLALIFMLLLAGVMCKLNNQANELKDTKKNLVSKLADELKQSGNVDVEEDKRDPLALIIVLGESAETLKFERGEYTLSNQDKQFLNKLMPKIFRVIYDDDEYRKIIDSIKIEGYTDNDPYKGNNNYSNVELSQARALEVFNYTRKYVLKDNAEHRTFFIDKTSINGKGDIPQYLQKNSDGTCCNKEKSRRVEIKIKIKSKDEEHLSKKVIQEE